MTLSMSDSHATSGWLQPKPLRIGLNRSRSPRWAVMLPGVGVARFDVLLRSASSSRIEHTGCHDAKSWLVPDGATGEGNNGNRTVSKGTASWAGTFAGYGGDATRGEEPSAATVFATGRPYRATTGNRGRKDRPLS